MCDFLRDVLMVADYKFVVARNRECGNCA